MTTKTRADRLRIRMYRVGFGDFFLLTAFTKKGPQHILIDCGTTGGRSGKGDIATLKAAVAHMAAETQNQLALIIVTHRHADHIIGFSRCEADFAAFKDHVGAIWMPCWEQAYAPALKVQAQVEQLALGLRAAALAGDRDPINDEVRGLAENAMGITSEGPGGGTNARSLALLKNGLGVQPSYHARGDVPTLPRSLVDAGFEADILGPPPIDHFDALKLENLAQGVGQYLDAAPGADAAGPGVVPFGAEWQVGADAYPPSAFREWAPRAQGRAPQQTQRHAAELQAAVRGSTPQALLVAARELDRVLNNQSLVVLLTWHGRKLLFAGDAQAGNWLYWLRDEGRTDPIQSTQELSAQARDLLSSLAFYKAGHHGSTNASPVAAVRAMGSGFVTMCSTQADTFGDEGNDSEVPRAPLMSALQRKSVVLRSDDFAARLPGREVPPRAGAPTRVPRPAQGRVETGDLYVDYIL